MKTIPLPDGVEIVEGPRGPRFRGAALLLRDLATKIRGLRDAPNGFVCHIGSVTLYVTDSPADAHASGRVSMPREAWNIMASKFTEVTAGWEDSPFDFGDCEYLYSPADPDLGVELVGDPERD